MKHIRTLLLGILLLSPLMLRSQSWFEGNPQWINYITLGWSGPGYEYDTVQGDTILDGKPAKTLKRFKDMTWANDHSDIRVARQNGDTVWCWNDSHQQFFVHYNFSLEVGDTVAVPIYWGGSGKLKYVIDSIGTIIIDNQPLRFQRVNVVTGASYFLCDALIVEKIGMVNGQCVNTNTNYTSPLGRHFFLDEPNSGATDGPEWTFCRFQNDQFVYQVPNPFCNGLVAAPETPAGSQVTILPNPFQDDFTVALSPGEKIASLRLFDISGKNVLQISGPAETKIHAGGLPPGVYFIEILTVEQKRYFGKLAH